MASYQRKGRADFKIISLEEEKKRQLEEEAKEKAAAASSEIENSSQVDGPDSLFGPVTDLSLKKITSTTTRESSTTAATVSVNTEFTDAMTSSTTADAVDDDVNLLDMDFGATGPMSM